MLINLAEITVLSLTYEDTGITILYYIQCDKLLKASWTNLSEAHRVGRTSKLTGEWKGWWDEFQEKFEDMGYKSLDRNFAGCFVRDFYEIIIDTHQGNPRKRDSPDNPEPDPRPRQNPRWNPDFGGPHFVDGESRQAK